MDQYDDLWEGETSCNGRQPNFLQKLYGFLSLDPHPYPDILYWATDSRQLVIAQPDRLAKEVLPRLFKHDKLASFGRQLNIYGFSRLFPGRQFKDADGNISDASVWAHPTLHRLSTDEEVSLIKRRAAPKLFRTRRLANGQVVRTKAGPAVEAKVREVRESIAESRRRRGSVVYENNNEQRQYPITPSPTPRTPAYANCTLPQLDGRGSVNLVGGSSSLNSIVENVASADVSSIITHEGLGIAGSVFQHNQMIHQDQFGNRTQSIDAVSGLYARQTLDNSSQQSLDNISYQARNFRSCPASIHTTPVPAPMKLDNAAWAMFHTLNPFGMTLANNYTDTGDHPNIAAPAASPPAIFQHPQLTINTSQLDITAYPLSPSSGFPSAVPTVANSPIPHIGHFSNDPEPNVQMIESSGFETTHSQTGQSWNRHSFGTAGNMLSSQSANTPHMSGTIDPRWVSPSSSVFNSGVSTPVISPVNEQFWTQPVHNSAMTQQSGGGPAFQTSELGQYHRQDLDDIAPPLSQSQAVIDKRQICDVYSTTDEQDYARSSHPAALHSRWGMTSHTLAQNYPPGIPADAHPSLNRMPKVGGGVWYH